jgi:ubiquinone/menaquinone biosynthesis C-methylase UbiE
LSAADHLIGEASTRAPGAVSAEPHAEQRAFGKKYKSKEYARYYSRKHKSSLMRRVSNFAERRMIRRALARVHRERVFRSVLDCPSGTGRFIPVIRGFDATLVTMDTSADMLREGRRQFASFPTSPSAIAGSVFDIPLADHAVDVVLCSRLLHHIPERADRVKILKEFARVARVGVVFSFFDANSFRAWRRQRKEGRKGRLGGRHSQSRSECDEEAHEAGLEPAGMTALLRFHTEVTAAVCFCRTDPGAGEVRRITV